VKSFYRKTRKRVSPRSPITEGGTTHNRIERKASLPDGLKWDSGLRGAGVSSPKGGREKEGYMTLFRREKKQPCLGGATDHLAERSGP